MRIVMALVAWFLLATFVPPGPPQGPPPPAIARLDFAPVTLDRRDPDRRRVGALTFLEGWALTSDDPRFGGISAMHVEESGAVTMISDTGILVRFRLPAPGSDSIPARIESLPFGPGIATRKGDRDAEAMVVHEDSVWLAFEGSNSIWRYDRRTWIARAATAPPAMDEWPGNRGSEAMLRTPEGRFLVFAESADRDDGSTELQMFLGDPAEPGTRTIEHGYRAPGGYQITDAAWLPDGRMLLLNRRFRWFEGVSARLVVADPPGRRPGTIVRGTELARLAPPLTVDNMEALSVTRENGRTIVWMASDDNYTPFQRTLLMKFALEE